MSISDTYVVQYLLQGTARAQHQIIWRQRPTDGAGFTATVGNLQVALENAYSRAGSRLILRFRDAQDEFYICEPPSRGWFSRRYSTQDDRALADSLQDLMRAVALQCNQRRLSALENPERVRDRVYRQLLFDQPEHAEQRWVQQVKPGALAGAD